MFSVYLVTRDTTSIHYKHTFGTRFLGVFFGPTRQPALGPSPIRRLTLKRAPPMWIHARERMAIPGWSGGWVGGLPNTKSAASDDVNSVHEHVTPVCRSETPMTRGKATVSAGC